MTPLQKIFIVITKGNWGGAQKYVYELATNLPSDRFDTTVVHGEGTVLVKKLGEANIKTRYVAGLNRDIAFGSDIAGLFSLIKIFRKEKPDVIHLNSSKVGGLGALAGRIARVKKIIFTVHGFAFNEDRSQIQKIIIKLLSWITIFLSTDTICISQKELNIVKEWPLVSKKVHLIYNGISEIDFKDKETAQKEIADKVNVHDLFSKYDFVVGSIGELTKNKGHCYGLKAFKDNPRAAWIIIGGGEERSSLEKIIDEKNISNVYLPGFIPAASTLLKAFDAFLLPSVKEGLPYVLIEAGQAGLPIIATRVGGIEEIIRNNKSGVLIPSKDPEIISSTISNFMANNKDIIAYGTSLSETCREKFGIKTMIEKTIEVYN